MLQAELKIQLYIIYLLQDEQIVDGRSYSDYTQNNFDCGRYKLFEDLDQKEEENNEDVETLQLREFSRRRRQTDEIDDDFVFYFSGDDKDSFFCGATIITDRSVTIFLCLETLEKKVQLCVTQTSKKWRARR